MNSLDFYQNYTQAMHQALTGLIVTDAAGQTLTPDAAFARWREWSEHLKQTKGTCYFVGNGASAMMSSHMAVDGTKNAGVNCLAFNDTAYITAIGNDLGYDQLFSFPLARFGRSGDLFVTISSSGNSPNVLRGIQTARELGLRVITLSGMKPDNRSRSLGDLNFYIPARTYGVVESAHAILLHCWLDHLMGTKEWELSA